MERLIYLQSFLFDSGQMTSKSNEGTKCPSFLNEGEFYLFLPSFEKRE